MNEVIFDAPSRVDIMTQGEKEVYDFIRKQLDGEIIISPQRVLNLSVQALQPPKSSLVFDEIKGLLQDIPKWQLQGVPDNEIRNREIGVLNSILDILVSTSAELQTDTVPPIHKEPVKKPFPTDLVLGIGMGLVVLGALVYSKKG